MNKEEYIDSILLENDRLYKENNQLKEKCEKQQYAITENCDLRLEIEQLKEQLEKKYEKTGTLTTEILYEENTKLQSVLKELRSWLEEILNELKQNDIYDRTSYETGQVIATECIIEKLNELEGKDE